jgi:hypothetical protein
MTARADAIEYARAFFEDSPPGRMDGRDLTYFLVAATVIRKDPSPEDRLMALELLERELYPEGRRESLVRALTGRRPEARTKARRGGDPFAYKTRDLIIVHAIHNICKQFGFKPLRSGAAKDKDGLDSACSIVKESLRLVNVHMTEAAVEKIWNKRNHIWAAHARPTPKGFPV